jgi:hypothetical protein
MQYFEASTHETMIHDMHVNPTTLVVLINGSTPPELGTFWEYVAVSSLHLSKIYRLTVIREFSRGNSDSLFLLSDFYEMILFLLWNLFPLHENLQRLLEYFKHNFAYTVLQHLNDLSFLSFPTTSSPQKENPLARTPCGNPSTHLGDEVTRLCACLQ